MDTNDIFSFKSIRNSISQFRQVNRYDGNRIYDEPGMFFWKPIFYFYNGDSMDNSTGLGNAGLLYPSWITDNNLYTLVEDDSNSDGKEPLCKNKAAVNDAQLVSCAYNYLLRNNELKRAALLKNFVELLSDINSKTPWYFREITGLDEAVSKKGFFESPKIEDTRKQITITCLADSVDTRIGNMLDMYRSACYSWQTKREIVPANLRKFDMGIYVFLRPYQEFYSEKKSILNSSHKYLEFHNCEIDLDSCKIGDTFNNDTASQIEYKIVISYDNCYDNRYSDFHNGIIGDAIITDMITDDFLFYDADNISFMQYDKEYGFTSHIRPEFYKHPEDPLQALNESRSIPLLTVSNGIELKEKSNINVNELKKIALKQPLDLEFSRKELWDKEDFYGKKSNDEVYDLLIKSKSSTSKRLLKNLMLEQPLNVETSKKNIYYGDRYSNSSKQSNFLTRAIDNTIDATVGTAKQALKSGVGGLLLGNLYHGSIAGSLRDIRQGRLVSGTAELINNLTNKETYEGPIQNIYGTVKEETVDKIKKSAKAIKSLGNLNSKKSTINNI